MMFDRLILHINPLTPANKVTRFHGPNIWWVGDIILLLSGNGYFSFYRFSTGWFLSIHEFLGQIDSTTTLVIITNWDNCKIWQQCMKVTRNQFHRYGASGLVWWNFVCKWLVSVCRILYWIWCVKQFCSTHSLDILDIKIYNWHGHQVKDLNCILKMHIVIVLSMCFVQFDTTCWINYQVDLPTMPDLLAYTLTCGYLPPYNK